MKLSQIIIFIGVILLVSLLIVFPWYPTQLIAGLLLIGFLPGYTLLSALWPDRSSGSTWVIEVVRFLEAVALSYGLTIALLLLTAFARTPITAFSVLGGLTGLSLIFTFIAWRRRSETTLEPEAQPSNTPVLPALSLANSKSYVIWLAIVLLIAGSFRIINVRYSDHQGDEADILLRAVSLSYGNLGALLTHSKGPGEILILSGIGALTGRFDEQTARLPFSVAGTVSVGLIFWLGGHLFKRWTGIIAGLLAAIDGVFVSYARTAQYQSVVLLLTLAAIWYLYRFHQLGGRSRRMHALGAFLLAASFLVHFETVFLLPVAAYLTLAHLIWPEPNAPMPSSVKGQVSGIKFQVSGVKGQVSSIKSHASRLTPHVSRLTSHLPRPTSHASRLLSLWPSVLIFTSIIAAFYIPFLLNPAVSDTGTYLENRIGGGASPPFNNLAHFFYFEALKYNSVYFVLFFNILLLLAFKAALVRAWGSRDAKQQSEKLSSAPRRPGPPAPYLVSLTVALLVLTGLGLALVGFQKVAALLLALAFALFFIGVIFSPTTPLPNRTLWLWIAPSFWIYVFLVNRPGKHHYLFLGALTILVGSAVTHLGQEAAARWSFIKRPAGQWLTAGLGIGVLLIFAAHTVMVLLRSDLEYVLTYPTHKSAFYPTDEAYPYGTRIGFGYPFRLGWQVVGQLKRTGQLEGTWAGNDEGNAPNWYMLNTQPTPCYPDYVLRGEITYKGSDELDVPFDPNKFGYVPRYHIWGNDRLRMTILAFDPLVNDVAPVRLDASTSFDPPVTAADFAPNLQHQSEAALPPAILLEPPLVLGEGSELKNNAPPEYLERAQQLQGRVALVGYDLDQRYAWPGGILPVTLPWNVQRLLGLRYKVFVHLIAADGRLGAQADNFPVCGTSHANTWAPGTTILDRHLLKLPVGLPPGDYMIVAGMYEPELNLRLNYLDVAGNEQGNSLTLGTVAIQPQ